MVLYEGRISVRCAQDIADATPIRGDWNPVDGAIESAAWSLAESRSGYEYVVVTTSTAATPFFNPLASTYGSLLYTIPGGGWLEVDLRDVSYRETGYGDIEADVEGIWDRVNIEQAHYHGTRTTHDWELMRWNVLALYLDGVPLSHPNDIPADFPMREVLAALEGNDTAQALQQGGPNR